MDLFLRMMIFVPLLVGGPLRARRIRLCCRRLLSRTLVRPTAPQPVYSKVFPDWRALREGDFGLLGIVVDRMKDRKTM